MGRLCNIYVALRRLYNTACINMVRFRLGLCRHNNYIHKQHNNPVGGVPCPVSLVSLIVTRPLVKRFKRRNKTTGTNADRHIGQVGFMLTDLTDIDETAQAKVGAETWTVKSDKAPLLKGTKIKVLAIEGVKLIVEPVSE